MDKKIPIKMLLDSLIENNDIIMCKVIGEKSGSTLIKLRVNAAKHGDQGGATPNPNVCRDSEKQNQVKSDLTKPQKHDGQSTGHFIKTRSRTAKEEPRSSSPYRDCVPLSNQVASPDSVLNSPDVASECLSFPDQSPVLPCLSGDGSNQSPVESEHHSGEEITCLSDSHGEKNDLCMNDSRSDSASMASDSQLEASSEYSGESDISLTDRNGAAQGSVQSNDSDTSSMSKRLLAFLSSERGEQFVASAVREGLDQTEGVNEFRQTVRSCLKSQYYDPVDDT